LALSKSAKPFDVEVLLMDDGWFGSSKYPRNNDSQGLGDWLVNNEKLPNGLAGLSSGLKRNGMTLGIWVEPEMINPRSTLFEQVRSRFSTAMAHPLYLKHPDWAQSAPGYPLTEARHQLLLDYSKREVQDWAIVTFTRLFENTTIEMVKWDHNRGLVISVSFCDEQA
jgi:alpha-galactosidase